MGGSSGGMDMADNTEQMMEQAMQGMDSEEFDTPMMEGLSGMGGMGGMMGVQPAKTQPPEVRLSRTKLNSILQHLHLGATGKPTTGIPSRNPGGLLASVSDEQKAAIEAWVTSVEGLVTNLNDENLDTREKYIEGLEVQASVLQGLLGDAEAAAEAADAANELDEVGIAG